MSDGGVILSLKVMIYSQRGVLCSFDGVRWCQEGVMALKRSQMVIEGVR